MSLGSCADIYILFRQQDNKSLPFYQEILMTKTLANASQHKLETGKQLVLSLVTDTKTSRCQKNKIF